MILNKTQSELDKLISFLDQHSSEELGLNIVGNLVINNENYKNNTEQLLLFILTQINNTHDIKHYITKQLMDKTIFNDLFNSVIESLDN